MKDFIDRVVNYFKKKKHEHRVEYFLPEEEAIEILNAILIDKKLILNLEGREITNTSYIVNGRKGITFIWTIKEEEPPPPPPKQDERPPKASSGPQDKPERSTLN